MMPIAFERATIRGIRVHVLPTDRFKTFAVSAYVGRPLQPDNVSATALIPFVLQRGTERHPQTKAFQAQLDNLYGAGFGFDIYKRGNNHIVQFRMDTVDDKYVGDEAEGLLTETLTFLIEAITKPALDNGAFVGSYVNAEKQTVAKKLMAVINDKIRYAAERCTQEMFKHDPFRVNALGDYREHEQLNAQTLYDVYQHWLTTAQIDVYVVGRTTLEQVKHIVDAQFRHERKPAAAYALRPFTRSSSTTVNTITERLDVSQGKLNMGLAAPFTYADEQYPAALMYNGIFGGYPHSRLFINVREKASLAYYASSSLDGFKGTMMIQSGIEVSKYDKALGIIREQLEVMRDGDITETELAQTKAMITNKLRQIVDSPYEMIAFDFNSVLSEAQRPLPRFIEQIEDVDAEAVRQIAREVELDTIYFLTDQKGG